MLKNGFQTNKERHGTISKFAENIVEYVIDNSSKAMVFTITDKQTMANIMQDANTCLEMIRHGVNRETNINYIER